MNKILLFALIVLGLLFGYNKFIKGSQFTDNTLVRSVQNSQQKTGNIVLTGTLLETPSGGFNLMTKEGAMKLKSNMVKLEDYSFEEVKVVGMFSGTSLYVDRVELR